MVSNRYVYDCEKSVPLNFYSSNDNSISCFIVNT
jgi:hypothetical protein